MPYVRLQDNGSERKGDGEPGADSNRPADNDRVSDNDGTADGNKPAVRYGYAVSVKYADSNAGDGTDRSPDQGTDACSDGAGAADSGTDPGAKCHTDRKADKSCYRKSGADIQSDRDSGSDRGTGLYCADTKRLAAGRGFFWEERSIFSGNV